MTSSHGSSSAAAADILSGNFCPAVPVDAAKRCYCYSCMCEGRAAECPDREFRCLQCSSTYVEVLAEREAPPEPPRAEIPMRRLRRDPTHRRRLQGPISARSRLGAEGTRHVGVICDGCRTRDFTGIRYRCLRCRDYDLCSVCHAMRSVLHPSHPFEAIRTPRSSVPAIVADFMARAATRTIVAIIEIGLEDTEARSGLDDMCIAWWLADDRQLVSIDCVASEDPAWCCPICSEGLEAEVSNGWVVKICTGASDGGEGSASLGGEISALDDRTHTIDRATQIGVDTTKKAVAACAADTTCAGAAVDLARADENASAPSTRAVGETSAAVAADVPETAQGHMYHEACLRKWLLKRNSCPVCRRSPVVPEP